jgi:hypothetical protein
MIQAVRLSTGKKNMFNLIKCCGARAARNRIFFVEPEQQRDIKPRLQSLCSTHGDFKNNIVLNTVVYKILYAEPIYSAGSA